jgi:hypothetical protein
MLIGTIKRTKYLGRVADRCLVCDDVQPFEVYDNYSIHHVNFLPLEEKMTGATRRCITCHTRISCETDAYSSILKDKEGTASCSLRTAARKVGR